MQYLTQTYSSSLLLLYISGYGWNLLIRFSYDAMCDALKKKKVGQKRRISSKDDTKAAGMYRNTVYTTAVRCLCSPIYFFIFGLHMVL